MKAIVTVVGKDRVGIIASVCTQLAAFNVNVLDISQTVMQGYFTMMMATEISQCSTPVCGLAKPVHSCAAGGHLPGYAPDLRTRHAESKGHPGNPGHD